MTIGRIPSAVKYYNTLDRAAARASRGRAVRNANLIGKTVFDEKPEEAAKIAKEIARVFQEHHHQVAAAGSGANGFSLDVERTVLSPSDHPRDASREVHVPSAPLSRPHADTGAGSNARQSKPRFRHPIPIPHRPTHNRGPAQPPPFRLAELAGLGRRPYWQC